MTITLQALSLVEKVKLVQVRFTLHLRDQRSIQVNECKLDGKACGFLHGIKWVVFNGHLDRFQKALLGGRA